MENPSFYENTAIQPDFSSKRFAHVVPLLLDVKGNRKYF